MNGRNMAASVRARLLNRARENKQDFNLILTRDARFYRAYFPDVPLITPSKDDND